MNFHGHKNHDFYSLQGKLLENGPHGFNMSFILKKKTTLLRSSIAISVCIHMLRDTWVSYNLF